MAQMLESASSGEIAKTRMMYTAFVPHEQMTELVDLLLSNDLLTFDQQTHLYRITTKGGQFLVSYNNMLGCLFTY